MMTLGLLGEQIGPKGDGVGVLGIKGMRHPGPPHGTGKGTGWWWGCWAGEKGNLEDPRAETDKVEGGWIAVVAP